MLESQRTTVELAQLRQVVEDYENIFAKTDFDLGATSMAQYSINTGDHPPIRQAPRRVPFLLCKKVDDMVDEMQDKGVI